MTEDLSIHAHFVPFGDFSDFFGSNLCLTDCQIILNNERISAHTIILANGSEFFYNAFTSGMEEEVKREVSIDFNPQNLFPVVLNWIYTSQISFEFNQLMPLLSIAKFYGVNNLLEKLENYLQNVINPDNLFDLVSQCYDNELTNELHLLIPFIAEFFDQISIQKMSDNLDVQVFCQVLHCYFKNNGFDPEYAINALTQFIGDYECTDEDYEAINAILDPNNPNIQKVYQKTNPRWAKF